MNFSNETETSFRGSKITSRRRLLSLGAAAGMATLLENPNTAYAAAKDEKFSEFAVNVKSYGATGDASTDDTAAFQRALDAAYKAGGGMVYAPAGRYLFRGTLILPEGVTLRGSFGCVP